MSLEYSTWRDVPDLPFNGEKIAHLAFCYTGTETGTNSGVRLLFTIEHAMKWCSSNLSRGQLHGTNWSFFWTAAPTFFAVRGPTLDLTGIHDNGEWDDRIASTGATKIPLTEWGDIFRSAGITVTGDGGEVRNLPAKPVPAPAPANQLSLLEAT